jgi:hypothetical protein
VSVALSELLHFTVEALEAEGALAERDAEGERAVALLPPDVARRLSVAEECHLALHPEGPDEVACGLGSPLLERLVNEARGRCPVASLRLALDAPRPAHVRSLTERFVLRNGVAELGQMTMGFDRYAVVWVAYAVEADDRREGLVRVVTSQGGHEPDEAVQQRLDLAWPDAAMRQGATDQPLGDAARWIVTRAECAVRAAAVPLLGEIRRRHGRDHERIASYFSALIAEARVPRRRMEPEAVEAKVAHLVTERDKKLRDLSERFAAQVRAQMAAAAWVEIPSASVGVRLRRRKESRDIALHVPAGAQSASKLACEGCGAATGKPAACDERLHLLCERCAPNPQGRIACPACGKKR